MIKAIPTTSHDQWLAARSQDVTASVAAALLGIHPYCTSYELWARKTGRMPDQDVVPTITDDSIIFPPMMRGANLEAAALAMLPRLRPDWINPEVTNGELYNDGRVYFRDEAARIGATPDAIRVCPEHGLGIVQIKTVEANAWKRSWINDDGGIEPPLWIVIQAIIEAHMVGAKWARIGALVVGGELAFHLIDVPLHTAIVERIKQETAAFWEMIERGEVPEPDYSADADTIRKLYAPNPKAEPVDLSADNALPELLDRREALKVREADGALASRERKPIDAELLHKLGTSSRASIAGGRIIEAKIIKRGAYEVAASSYPQIKITDDTKETTHGKSRSNRTQQPATADHFGHAF